MNTEKKLDEILNQINGTGHKISTGKRGAISEMLVACDLLNKGFEVFRAVSASASCDLVIFNDNEIVRIEVRTGNRNMSGSVNAGVSIDDIGRFDILAIVVGDNIEYFSDDDINITGTKIIVRHKDYVPDIFSCTICGREFTHISGLKSHSRVHNRNDDDVTFNNTIVYEAKIDEKTTTIPLVDKNNNGQEKIKCPNCEMLFMPNGYRRHKILCDAKLYNIKNYKLR